MPTQSTVLSKQQRPSHMNDNKITKKKFNELKKQSRQSTIAKIISDDKIRKVAMKNFQHFVDANMLPVEMPQETSLKVSNNNNYRTVAINMPNFRAKYEYLGNNTEGYRAVYNDDNQYIEENRMFTLQCFPPEACNGSTMAGESATVSREAEENEDDEYDEEEEVADYVVEEEGGDCVVDDEEEDDEDDD